MTATIKANPELPLIRVRLVDAVCYDCHGDVTVWRTGIGLLTAARRQPGDPIMERHQCVLTLADMTANIHV